MVNLTALIISLTFNAVLACVFLYLYMGSLLEVLISCWIDPLVHGLSYIRKHYMPRCMKTMGRYVKEFFRGKPTET